MKKAHHHTVLLMGCRFTFTAIHEKPQVAWDGIRAGIKEVERIERLISSWRSDSDTSRINCNAGKIPTIIDEELFHLITRSIKVSVLTGGAFDISGEVSRKIWDFKNHCYEGSYHNAIARTRSLVNYKDIQTNSITNEVLLTKEGMMIGFGGIGKGYASEQAASVMQKVGVEDGFINASGDIFCWGQALGSKLWPVEIMHPEKNHRSLLSLNISSGSVVTSGDYENYVLINGKRHSHIIDPRSGRPVSHIKSVTVTSPSAELADALATAFSVLEVVESMDIVHQLKGVECLIIDDHGIPHYSENLKPNNYENKAA